jgi:hypothetical protein
MIPEFTFFVTSSWRSVPRSSEAWLLDVSAKPVRLAFMDFFPSFPGGTIDFSTCPLRAGNVLYRR